MISRIFNVNKSKEYRKAGQTDLIQLLPYNAAPPLCIPKWILEDLVDGIVNHEFIHISGPTGTGKTSLIEALYLEQRNFNHVCLELGYRILPLKVEAVKMCIYETPGEVIQRRAINNGTSYDENSSLVAALEKVNKIKDDNYVVIWTRELGRVHSSSIQGGLLDLITDSNIVLPDGTSIDGHKIAWIADSNYQAENDSTHTLAIFDDALKRRFTINPTMDYLPADQEKYILHRMFPDVDLELISNVVNLGETIRRNKAEGNLQSLVPPTINGYKSFLRKSKSKNDLRLVAMSTLLGHVSKDDENLAASVYNEIFGILPADDEDLNLEESRFF
jgi:hypothetical protein